jgi:protein-L-isoaspartate O-methyltransferase
VEAWDAFSEDYLQRAIVSSRDIHYGLCIAGEFELRLLPPLRNRRVLDVGCGGGENSLAIEAHGAFIVGIEPVKRFYDHAVAARPAGSVAIFLNCKWGCKSVEEHAPYDLILFVGSSEFIPLDSHYFRILNGLTAAGSTVVIARMHPFWTSLYNHETGVEDRRNYFRHGQVDRVRYGSVEFHRLHYGVGELTGRFSAHGWILGRIVEPEIVSRERAPFYMPGCYEDEILMERMQMLPMTLLLTFVRQ